MQTTNPTQPTAEAGRDHRESHVGPDDPRNLFARAVALGGTVVGGVRPDQLDDPTPCADFDARELIGHLVGVLVRVAAVGRGENPMGVDVATVVGDDGGAAAWAAAAHAVQEAWTDAAALERTVSLPWATLTGAETLGAYTCEVTVHTWDLATATGQQPSWDPEVLELAFASIRRDLPAEGRLERYAEVKAGMPEGAWTADPFAPAVEVAADAPLVDRLVAFTGRRP